MYHFPGMTHLKWPSLHGWTGDRSWRKPKPFRDSPVGRDRQTENVSCRDRHHVAQSGGNSGGVLVPCHATPSHYCAVSFERQTVSAASGNGYDVAQHLPSDSDLPRGKVG